MQSVNSINTFFVCATQTSNLGDLIINKKLIDELCEHGNVYIDVFGIPGDFKHPLLDNPRAVDVADLGFTVKRPSLKNIIKYINLIRQSKIKVVTRSPGPLEEPSSKVRFGFILINLIAKVCGCRIIYFGSCCSEAIAKKDILRSTYMDSVFVRSYASMNYAKGFFKCNVGFIPDMAFLHNNENRCLSKKKIVAVDFREVSDRPVELLEDIKNNIEEFLNNGYGIELFYQVKGDKKYVEQLYYYLNDERVVLKEDLVWYNDIDYFADKAFVYSNRLHSLLIGVMYGAIPIARITDDPRLLKIKHVYDSSMPQLLCNTIYVGSQLNFNILINEYENLQEQLDVVIRDNTNLIKNTISRAIDIK